MPVTRTAGVDPVVRWRSDAPRRGDALEEDVDRERSERRRVLLHGACYRQPPSGALSFVGRCSAERQEAGRSGAAAPRSSRSDPRTCLRRGGVQGQTLGRVCPRGCPETPASRPDALRPGGDRRPISPRSRAHAREGESPAVATPPHGITHSGLRPFDRRRRYQARRFVHSPPPLEGALHVLPEQAGQARQE